MPALLNPQGKRSSRSDTAFRRMGSFSGKCIFLPGLLTVFMGASSQSNFMKATVVNLGGDSLYGRIDYRNWKNNPKTISFVDDSNVKQTLDASSIRAFYIPEVNETYASFTVEMNLMAGDRQDAISHSLGDSASVTKTAFLLQLISHPGLRLYQYSDRTKDHFYYQKGDEMPVELVHYFYYDEAGKRVRENSKYREQLSALLVACPDVAGKSATIRFGKQQVQHIFQKYLQCISPGTTFSVKREDSISLKFGVVAGVMSNTFTFEGSSELVDENYSGNTSPILGVSFDVGLPRNRNKWHIVNELIDKSYKTGSRFTRPYGAGYTRESAVEMQFAYLQLNSMLRYMFLSGGAVRPFINAGVGNAVMIAEKRNTTHHVYSFGRVEDMTALDGPRNFEFSLHGGVGLTTRNVQAEFRYGFNKKGFSPSYSLDVSPVSYQFLATYQF